MPIVRSNKSKVSKQNFSSQKLTAVRVTDIILNKDHPDFETYGAYDSIGTIRYTILKNKTPQEDVKKSNIAKPLFSHLKYYPLVNEVVLILNIKDKTIYNENIGSTTYYLPQVNIWNHPHHNALPSLEGLESEATAGDYTQTGNGIIRKVEDGDSDITLGEYFQEQLNIKPLLPYEGDTIIEGRFGNSIRFGSTNIGDTIPEENKNQWSHTGNTGDPITIIRNGQSENTDGKGWVPIIEDTNSDLTSIILTSNQQLKGFTPASLNQKSYGANLEVPQTVEQKLTDPTPEPILESEPTPPPKETQADPVPVVDEPTTTPPPAQTRTEPEEDELSPFDDFAGDVDEVGEYEIEEGTDNQQLNTTSPIIFPPDFSKSETLDLEQSIGNRGWKLKTFLASQIATDKGINNAPPPRSEARVINNLKALMENVGDLIYDQYGDKMYITSGYRSPALNAALDPPGSPNSEHSIGAAIDIVIDGVPTSEVFNWCIDNIPTWNQIIWEYPERGQNKSWIHISYRSSGNKKRKTLASKRDDIHAHFGGERRGSGNPGNYQDFTTRAYSV